MEQVFFNVPLLKLEPIFKRWVKDVLNETRTSKVEPTEPDHPLTVEEAAKFLDLTIPTVYSKVSKRELPSMKRNRRLYFLKSDLLEYLQAGRKKTNAEIQCEVDTYLKKRGSK